MVVRDEQEDDDDHATPIMCQYAEIVFSRAVTLTLNRFRSSAASSTTAYVR